MLTLVGRPAGASPRAAEALAAADVVADAATCDAAGIEAALRAGRSVALVVDGGVDPVSRLVGVALGLGVPVTAAPGPSRVTVALALSGLPAERFCVEGRVVSDRLPALAAEPRTLVFFAAPTELVAAFGPERRAALVGADGEVRRGPLGELAPRPGEVTLVVAGAPPGAVERPVDSALAAAVASLESGGTPRKAAIAEIATAHGLSKRVVYDAVVRAKT